MRVVRGWKEGLDLDERATTEFGTVGINKSTVYEIERSGVYLSVFT